MTQLLAARTQMALSLGFHIIFAAIGIAMPFLMAAAHALQLRNKDRLAGLLTRAWARGVAIFFAVGAVSGTLLSFELGLLWPTFMLHAGPIIGMPFSWEGTAFFLEAIFLGLFLYGWERLPPLVHWFCGLMVGVCGVLSGLFVVCANAWMNAPAGFVWEAGRATQIDPWAAMFNAAALHEGIHMTLAAFVTVGFAVAGLHALLWLRSRQPIHQLALRIALVFGGVAALLQPLSGDRSAKAVAHQQPVKLAAMEGHFTTQRGAPLQLFGLPDEASRTTPYALRIPYLLSVLAFGDPQAEVRGLNDFPRRDWPPVRVVHLAFQVMVGAGSVLAAASAALLFAIWRGRDWLQRPGVLRALVAASPLGLIAHEAGWVVTEVGRQPYIIYGIMRTADSVTARPDVIYSLCIYALMYLFLAVVVLVLLRRQAQSLHAQLAAIS